MADNDDQRLQALGERLQALRKVTGHSQQSLYDVVKIDRTHISKLENGRLDPRLSTLAKLADAYGTTVAELLADLY